MKTRFKNVQRETWSSAAFVCSYIGVAIIVIAFPLLGLGGDQWLRQITLIAILSLAVSGLNLSFGYAGELSFAIPAMYAGGAYVTAYVAINLVNDLALILIVAAVVGFAVGLLSGIPGLRLGGWMLATSSFFLVILVPDIAVIFKDALGGHEGIAAIPRPQVFGFELGPTGLYIVAILVTTLWFASMRNLVTSRFGRALALMRQSHVLAASLGISVYGLKLRAYAFSGVPAAFAGALFAYLDGFIAPSSFGVTLVITILAASILGGKRSVLGVLVGASILHVGSMRITVFGEYALVAYGALLILVGVLLPSGIVGVFEDMRSRFRRGVDHPVRREVEIAEREVPPMAALPGKALSVKNLNKRFGGNTALHDVSFNAEPGQVLALVGANGSGKTTLLNVINGVYKPDAGSISLAEEDITNLPTHLTARAGVLRTFQTPIVPEMTVRDSVSVARFGSSYTGVFATIFRTRSYRNVVLTDRAIADNVLEQAGLSNIADAPAASLPLGTRRVLELARCLAAEPSVLLLDEVASGLDEGEISSFTETIKALRSSGCTVILVEHNFSLVRELADQILVLSQGRVVTQGSPDEVAQHDEVLTDYLGQSRTTS